MLQEVIERIRAFSFHPEYVPRVLSWAQRGGLSLAITRTLGRYLCVRRDRGLSP